MPPQLPREVMLKCLEPFKEDYDYFDFAVGDPTYVPCVSVCPTPARQRQADVTVSSPPACL
jgi:hypothetical protein